MSQKGVKRDQNIQYEVQGKNKVQEENIQYESISVKNNVSCQ